MTGSSCASQMMLLGRPCLWIMCSTLRCNRFLLQQCLILHVDVLQHPVYCVNVVGTQNAHNLITVSTDGKMCSWSLDMLSTPQVCLFSPPHWRILAQRPASSRTHLLKAQRPGFSKSDLEAKTYFLYHKLCHYCNLLILGSVSNEME